MSTTPTAPQPHNLSHPVRVAQDTLNGYAESFDGCGVFMHLPSYRYEGLAAPDYIRLVTILPGDRGSAMKLSIEHADINSHPRYECLSYAWGTDDHKQYVEIDCCSLPVTTTLYVALEHLRHASQERKVWIDAICINQKDITERNSQVAIMRNIYRNAMRVIVWVGPDTKSSEQAMMFLKMLATARKDRSWFTIGWSKFDQRVPEPANSPTHWERLKSCLIQVYASMRRRILQFKKPKSSSRLEQYRERRKEGAAEYTEAVATAEATKHDFCRDGLSRAI